MGLRVKRNKATGRDYSYDREYESTEIQKKRRAARNRARRIMEKAGRVHKGDGKDVDHKTFHPDAHDTMKELDVMTASANRAKKPPRLRKKH